VQARARQGNASSAAAAALASDSVLASLAQSALSIISRAESGAPLVSSSHQGVTQQAQGSRPSWNHASSLGSSAAAAAGGGGGGRGGGSGKPSGKPGVTGNNKPGSGSSGAGGGAGGASNKGPHHSSSSSTYSSSSSSGKASLLGAPSPKAAAYVEKLKLFLEECVYPVEQLLEEHHRWGGGRVRGRGRCFVLFCFVLFCWFCYTHPVGVQGPKRVNQKCVWVLPSPSHAGCIPLWKWPPM
jgi:hypothetical protein